MTHVPITINPNKSNAERLKNIYKFYFSDNQEEFEIFLIISLLTWRHGEHPKEPLALATLLFINQYYEKPTKKNKRLKLIS